LIETLRSLQLGIVHEASDGFFSQEAKSVHDILGLRGAGIYLFIEPLYVQGVEHSAIRVRDVSLVEEVEYLASVKVRVASWKAINAEGALRSPYKVHAKVHHALSGSEVLQVGALIVEKVSLSPLFTSKSKHINFRFLREELSGNKLVF
jgi:hypothetical protein